MTFIYFVNFSLLDKSHAKIRPVFEKLSELLLFFLVVNSPHIRTPQVIIDILSLILSCLPAGALD
jgi:hypothetical protein